MLWRRRAVALASVAGLTACLLLPARPALAGVTRLEAEAMATPAACWSAGTAGSGFSGTGYRSCAVTGQALTWSTTITTGETGSFVLQVYRDSEARPGRVSVNGGAWSSFAGAAGTAGWVVGFTSATLPAGTHSIALEATSTAAVFLDYAETTTAATTTTTTGATTTTVAPTTTTSTTTTTTVPPVTSEEFEAFHRDVLGGLALLVFLAAAFVVGNWGRRG